MKVLFPVIAFILSSLFAFVLLTINVGDVDIGGPAGTLVLPKDTSPEAAYSTFIFLKVAGVFWAVVSIASLLWVIRRLQ